MTPSEHAAFTAPSIGRRFARLGGVSTAACEPLAEPTARGERLESHARAIAGASWITPPADRPDRPCDERAIDKG